MHGTQTLAPRIVDTGNLSHVDFTFLARAGHGEPHIFRCGNPGAAKFAIEFQATLAAILKNCDSELTS
jgi:hypothetical protein